MEDEEFERIKKKQLEDLLKQQNLNDILKNENYEIRAEVFGEMINLKKHEFKVEIKSPTFHEMEIKEGDKIVMKYLLDL